ncbi:MAG: tRNA (adenosine(37)-N6)-threonylcarbamoyltransferase complex dimerization subunit type 1 TsaB [Dongiaceae bacterium]
MSATILAFDSAGAAVSAALCRGGVALAARSEPMERGHGERLLPLLKAVMAEAATGFDALDAIAVAVGPGRFTGLRIGVAAARGLALATGKPAIGIGSFEAAAAALAEGPARSAILVAIDSRREELFAQLFDRAGEAVGAPLVATPDAIAATLPAGALLVTGDGARLMERALAGRGDVRILAAALRPEILARRAEAALRQGHMEPARPIYLRAPDAKLPAPPP